MTDENKTLKEARDETRAAILAGAKVTCPCCKQLVKIYPRPISAQMARWLIALVRMHAKDPHWIHVHEIGVALGLGPKAHAADFAKLRYWHLIESREKDSDDTTRRSSGYWRPTDHGIGFVRDSVRVPSHAKIYDAHFLGWKDPNKLVTIRDSLRKEFNYDELMRTPLK
ncbi:MAG TPA: hypothetical protein VE907_06355 [Gammaproteobacteria bacterium]|nr:hypothetical protein [Gammaproteobacteria bacterium]